MKNRLKKGLACVVVVCTMVGSSTICSNAATTAVVKRSDGKFWAKMQLTRYGGSIGNGSYHSCGVTYIGSYVQRDHSISWATPNQSYNMYVNGIYYLGLEGEITKVDVPITFYNYY